MTANKYPITTTKLTGSVNAVLLWWGAGTLGERNQKMVSWRRLLSSLLHLQCLSYWPCSELHPNFPISSPFWKRAEWRDLCHLLQLATGDQPPHTWKDGGKHVCPLLSSTTHYAAHAVRSGTHIKRPAAGRGADPRWCPHLSWRRCTCRQWPGWHWQWIHSADGHCTSWCSPGTS